MAFVLADRVKETASAPGTGTVTLLGAATGYQSFSAGIGASNTTYYTIADQSGSNWEVGYGTIGAGGTTLARTTVLASSNSGSLVNFSSGTQDVWCDYPAKKAVSLDSAGAIRGGSNTYLDFENGTGTTVAAGRFWYNDSDGTWNAGMGGGNITQQIGEELFRYGKASAAITDSPLQLVYKTGTVGASGVITFAPAVAGITDSNQIIGCATENIALNGFGRITTYGVIHNITTNGTAYGETWADNDDIYYNPTTGGLTKTVPSAPGLKMFIGTVINAGSGSSGSFIVKLTYSSYLKTQSDVTVTSPTGGQLLTYNQTGGYWQNTSLSAGTGITVTPATGGGLTVTNSGVTSVTGTAPVVSSGGTTPAISMAAATTSVNGYLTSTDWTTFNGKQAALVSGTNIKTVGGVSLLGAGDVGTIGATYGGTAQSTYTTGDILYASASNTLSKLAVGTTGQVLTVASGVPSWAAASGGGATITPTTSNTTYYVIGTSSTSGTNTTDYISNTNVVSYNASTGALNAVSVNGTSDERLKKDWKDVASDFIAKLAKVKHGIFTRISSGNREPGVSAQSLQQVLPEAVIEMEDGMLAVNYGGAALLAAVELAKEVQALRAEIELLKDK